MISRLLMQQYLISSHKVVALTQIYQIDQFMFESNLFLASKRHLKMPFLDLKDVFGSTYEGNRNTEERLNNNLGLTSS